LNGYKDPSSSINIYSKKSKVFAITEGKIKKISTIDNSKYIIIQNNKSDSMFVYANIEELFIDSNANVKKGDLIGKLKKDSSNRFYVLTFSITDYNLNFLNYIELYNFFIKFGYIFS
jgi:hypothetical protein